MKSFAIGLGMCLGLAWGCASEVSSVSPVPDDGQAGSGSAPSASGDDGALVEKVYQGVATQFQSVVGLYFSTPCMEPGSSGECFKVCTGAMVTDKSIITAAHCIDQLNMVQYASNVFYGKVAVTYGDPYMHATYCLTRNAGQGGILGHCDQNTVTDYRYMIMEINPDYIGREGVPESDTGDDVAIVTNYAGGAWPDPVNNMKHWARVAYGSIRSGSSAPSVKVGDQFTHVGFGTNSETNELAYGTIRYDTDKVKIDYVGNEHFYDNASSVRVCHGDSGAPAFVLADGGGKAITVGVLSNTSAETGSCVKIGAHQRWAKTESNIDWFRTSLADWGSDCHNTTLTAGSISYKVMECNY